MSHRCAWCLIELFLAKVWEERITSIDVIFYPQTVDKNREELFLVRGSKGLISTLINETLCKSIFLGTRRIERERETFSSDRRKNITSIERYLLGIMKNIPICYPSTRLKIFLEKIWDIIKRYNWRLSSELNFEPRRRIKVNYDAKTSEKILAGYFKWKLMISRGKQKRNYSWEIVNSTLWKTVDDVPQVAFDYFWYHSLRE